MVDETIDEPFQQTAPIVLEVPVAARSANEFGLHVRFVLKPREYLFCRGVAATLAESGIELSNGTPIYDSARLLKYLLQQADQAMPRGKGTVTLTIPAPSHVPHTSFSATIDMKLTSAECSALCRMTQGLYKRRVSLESGIPIHKPTHALKHLLQLAMRAIAS
jgi:hypothetical protein